MEYIKKTIKILLILMILLSGTILAESDEGQDMLNNLFSYENSKIEDLFHQSLLEQVPADKVIEIIKLFKNKLGSLKQVTGKDGDYTLIFEEGTAPAKIGLNEDNKIIGLWFGNWTINQDTVDKIITGFKNLEGLVSVCIIKNNKETVFAYNENKPMAVGSTFKLVVLKALYDTMKTENISWDNVIIIRNKDKSLPSGILQEWPVSTPVTIKTLSNLMISLSDNTATDHLIDYIGKEKIEEYVSENNKPFLTTNEMFRLKYGTDSETQRKYINGNLSEKRNILKKISNMDLNKIKITSTPTLINQMEWFFTTKELCRLIYELKGMDEISINSGLVLKENWNKVGYKGGSEPGVLQYTHLLQKNEGSNIYAISVTVNNDKSNLSQDKITELTTRLISLVEKGKL